MPSAVRNSFTRTDHSWREAGRPLSLHHDIVTGSNMDPLTRAHLVLCTAHISLRPFAVSKS